MPDIPVTVREKHARLPAPALIVAGNSDYRIVFDLDSEWSAFPEKTAVFTLTGSGGRRQIAVPFSGNAAAVPCVQDAAEIAVGLTAGALHTAAEARIPCARCITDGQQRAALPVSDIYNEILGLYAAGTVRLPLADADGCLLTDSDGLQLTVKG